MASSYMCTSWDRLDRSVDVKIYIPYDPLLRTEVGLESFGFKLSSVSTSDATVEFHHPVFASLTPEFLLQRLCLDCLSLRKRC